MPYRERLFCVYVRTDKLPHEFESEKQRFEKEIRLIEKKDTKRKKPCSERVLSVVNKSSISQAFGVNTVLL